MLLFVYTTTRKRSVCNFNVQVFQIKLKYHCSQPIKLQKFLMQQYKTKNPNVFLKFSQSSTTNFFADDIKSIWFTFFTPTLFIGGVLAVTFIPRPMNYRKIPKISAGAYIFQKPFLKGLFLEGLIFGEAYLQREICVSNSIAPACQLEGNLPFLLCFSLYLRAIFKYKPPVRLIFGGAI